MDLRTTYLGMNLKNPIVPSASPLSRSISTIRKMEDNGAAAVVLYSLFEEELNHESRTLDRYLTEGTHSFAEALSYFPEARSYDAIGPDSYLEHIHRAKKAVDMPIIASLNGVSTGGWVNFAKQIEGAGADALELNVYFLPTNMEMSGAEVEQGYLDLLRDIKKEISIPIALKLSPYFSATANMMKALVDHGADGLVLFNRFFQPDLDLENLEITPHLVLSSTHEMRLPLRWIAILHGRLDVDLALTTGVHTADDALKSVAAGAVVVQMASELLRNGVGRIGEILAEMSEWLVEHEYESLDVLKGSMSQINCGFPAAFERANYLEVVRSFSPTFK
jgi:dihydroorotate dehydrogenase (fumarate)